MRGYCLVALIAAVVASADVEVLANQIRDVPVKRVECPAEIGTVQLPHPAKCTIYIVCQNGEMTILTCPKGLHFNPLIRQCDWPPAGCVPQKDGVGTQPDKPEDREEEPTVTECIGTCPITDPKDKTVHLPTNDCSKFCTCFNGDGILMICPEGLHFDKKLQVCNWPRQAKCQQK